ncbi:DUF72 domain-containing protein [Devosia chinhatensis]|uniref:DUF72 domain-containing protein n=1 Tax=Devosia chinhatensis TaxID=429727 RepID=A0A0F5FFI5_9HYPH|nr:DUF72 domain-containing protein [Devosia chinhatensis]KKB07606.1 hypothetical protein VE26_12925 [Devosia chinhatensis]
MTTKGVIRTGTAGWVYAPWRGTFYPQGLVQKHELAYASAHLTSIEINATFRANQKPESFARWAAASPETFRFSIKGPQLVTHIRRLKNCRTELATFLASGPLALGSRLGPFVWQLPPNLPFDPETFADFLALLPKSVKDYQALAAEADTSRGPTHLDATGVEAIRHAIEPRHESFDSAEAEALLQKHNVARVIVDTIEHPSRTLTADFAYCRLQGPARPDAQGYGAKDLADWASTMAGWRDEGHDVFAYFVHEDKLHAPANAIALRKALGIALPND